MHNLKVFLGKKRNSAGKQKSKCLTKFSFKRQFLQLLFIEIVLKLIILLNLQNFHAFHFNLVKRTYEIKLDNTALH